jgi:hypothetical protein
MQSVPEQIFVGVVGGVLTSAFLYLLGFIFLRAVLPWYRRITYGGVQVGGTWEYLYDGADSFGTMVLQLTQRAHQLTGDAAATVRSEHGEENFIYAVQGTLWEGYASLTLKSKDPRVIAFATLLLKVTSNGSRFEGIYAFREPTNDRPVAREFYLHRK